MGRKRKKQQTEECGNEEVNLQGHETHNSGEPETKTLTRLDTELTRRGLAPTRSRAREIIKSGHVFVNGNKIEKPAQTVTASAVITLSDQALVHVSRGALKLRHALEVFDLNAKGKLVLDIGASTGGFTEVLLEQGAAHVYAVDVGHGQLHEKLQADERVTSLEGRDARSLHAEEFAAAPTALTIDVSFISLEKALSHPLTLMADQSWLVALIKPQFEVGPEGLNKKGVVKNEELGAQSIERMKLWLEAQQGWSLIGLTPSPIKGHAGNQEMLIAAVKNG
ncbi:MAG: TlyA family rRNA (cytidine-2'-O)-methyltransferase [Rhodomicrobium sp.]|nr:MAG: TlyA family rRNA (cytidine-2'-O)-methyltransferase [Rhodomicrobium sp.]